VIAALREHEVEWLAPAPLWGAKDADKRAPALVRIDGDDFMDKFSRMLNPGPHREVALWAARSSVEVDGKAAGVLYQPIHGCYALACASLTCRAAGRPEKAIAPARGDSVGFVLRRVEIDRSEFAWVPAGSGEGAWKVAKSPVPMVGEDVIPMFPVPAPGSPVRRIWTGLLPTASRETYQPGPPPKNDPAAKDWRIAALTDGPLAALAVKNSGGKQGNEAALQAALSLVEFINENVVLANIKKGEVSKFLDSPELGPALVAAGLKDAMQNAWNRQGQLLGTVDPDADYPGDTGGLTLPVLQPKLDAISAAIVLHLQPSQLNYYPPTGRPTPKFDLDFAGERKQFYIVRCVYVRNGCPPVASAASEEFSIASVHDPDAPARTIRIPMPIDTSVAGLRKFKKKVGFVLSPMLNAQVKSLSGVKLKDVDDGKLNSGSVELGEICTFALPIITLCAMIVLYIFLALLNIVFFWMPFLKICLPIPKGKSS
jgi:hypothetical protein